MRLKKILGALLSAVMLASSFGSVYAADNTTAEAKTWNFRSGSEILGTAGVKLQGTSGETAGLKIDATASTAKWDSTRTDWAQINTGTIVDIPVDGAATITVGTYSAGKTFTLADTDCTTDDSKSASALYTGEAGYARLTMTSNDYIGSITVEPYISNGEGTSFMLWLDDYANTNNLTTIPAGDIKTAGGTVSIVSDLDVYTGGASEFDGVTHSAYANGGDGTRVKGDGSKNGSYIPTIGTAIGFTPAIDGVMTLYTYFPTGKSVNMYTHKINDDGTNSYIGTTKGEVTAYTFDAKYGEKYYFDTTSTGNLAFCGIKFLVNEPLSVPVSVTGASLGSSSIIFIDADTNTEFAKIKANTNQVTLLKGHSYNISTDDGGLEVKFSDGSKKMTFTGEEDSINMVIDTLPDVELSGTITGEGMTAGNIKSLTFTKISDSSVSYTYNAEDCIDVVNSTYKVSIKPGEYKTSAVTTNGYTTIDRVSVDKDNGAVNEIYFVAPDVVTYNLDEEINNSGSALTFSGFSYHSRTYGVSGKVGATVTLPVKENQRITVTGGYDGIFTVVGNSVSSIASDSGNTFTAVYNTDASDSTVNIEVAETGNVAAGSGSAYIKSVKVENISVPVDFKTEISVPADYNTLTEAISAIKNMSNRPKGSDGLVTINITEDIFEQVVVDVDNIRINGNGNTLSWYYGYGAKYYSVGSDGLYNEELARDKYEKTACNAAFWGGVLILKGSDILTENLIIKNTFNYEVTAAEVEDGVERDAGSSANANWKDIPRTVGTDVHTATFRERANAVALSGDNLEFYNCSILSSQDTLGWNGSGTNHSYFKNCTIGGNTDFICGAGTMIFDNCTIEWFMDGQTSQLGYITAAKTEPYVFRNCNVVRGEDKYNTADTVSGYYGRCWGGADTKTYFINTEVNGTINDIGWYNMNGVEPENADYIEYGNTSNGIVFGPTQKGNIKNAATLEHYTDEEVAALMADYTGVSDISDTLLNGWKPVHYENKTAYAARILRYISDIDGGDGSGMDADKSGEVNILDAVSALK